MRFEGIYTPIVTPFFENGSIDWTAYAEVIEWQIESGVAGVVIGGSTGEFYALTNKERIEQFEFASKLIDGQIELMAGVNHMRPDECLYLSNAARDAGAKSLLIAAPPYSLPTEEELAVHILNIGKASGLPMMLYNYPGRTGVEMGETFLKAVVDNQNIVAVKESSGEIERLQLLANRYPEVELVVGAEEQVLEFASWGAKAWVCASGNIFPSECVAFLNILCKQKDFERGRQIMSALMPMMTLLEQGGKFVQSVKYGYQLQRGRKDSFVRPPMLPLSNETKVEMTEIVETAHFALASILNQKPL